MQLLDNIAEKINSVKKVAGVQLYILRDGGWQVNYTIHEKSKDNLALTAHYKDISYARLLELHNPAIPLSLSVEGKGVILRHQVLKEIGAFNLSEILPSANANDFYYHVAPTYNQYFLIGIARKEMVDAIIEKFLAENLLLANLSLGPSSVVVVSPAFSFDQSITTQSAGFTIVDNMLQRVSLVPVEDSQSYATYTIEGKSISGNEFVAYANAVALAAQLYKNLAGNLPDLSVNWHHKTLYKKLLPTSLALLLIIFLGNFLWFSSLRDNNQVLQQNYQNVSVQLSTLEKLQNEAKQRNYLIEVLSLDRQSLFAYYSDKVGQKCPESIFLSKLVVNPGAKQEGDRKIIYTKDEIYIEGVCDNPAVLNEWLTTLSAQPWVKRVKNQRYSTDAYKNTGQRFSFTLNTIRP